jgi:hypothetical protein
MMCNVDERCPSRFRWLRAGLPALVFALFAGCVHQDVDGTEMRYRYEYWVPAAVGLAGLVATPAGWFLRPKTAKFGWTLLILGPLAVFLITPSMMFDRLTVNDQGFHLRTGFLGSTAVDVDFDQVGTVRQTAETTSGRRSRTTYYLLFEKKTGGEPAKISLGNEMVKAAARAILQRVAARGVPFIDQT